MKRQTRSEIHILRAKELTVVLIIFSVIATVAALRVFFGSTNNDAYMVCSSIALLIIMYSSTIIAISVIYLKKEISLDDNFLYVANRKKEIQIPISSIADIKSKRGIVRGSWKITVYLKKPSDFGNKVKFLVDAPPNLESDYINSLSD